MSRKRLDFSVSNTPISSPSLPLAGQIIFTLTPESGAPQPENTIVWQVLNLGSGGPWSLQWSPGSAFSMVKITHDGSVQPTIKRVVPKGHHAVLSSVSGGQCWNQPQRLEQDMPNSVVARNETVTNQTIAICTTFIETGAHEPSAFLPFLLFRSVEPKGCCAVKKPLTLNAFHCVNLNLKEGQLLSNRIRESLRPVLNENGSDEWSIILARADSHPSWYITRAPHGPIYMTSAITRSSTMESDITSRSSITSRASTASSKSRYSSDVWIGSQKGSQSVLTSSPEAERGSYLGDASGASMNNPWPLPHSPQQYLDPQPIGINTRTLQSPQPPGRKKALCIGINYTRQKGAFKGCVNDAQNMRRFLIENCQYQQENIVLLTDDPKDIQRPTRENILKSMRWLVHDARPDDVLFLHYSGNGGQVKDQDGDEADGLDEVIYPVDFRDRGEIVDDHLHDILVKPLPEGCRLTAVLDSSHSGTALDLPFTYSTEGDIKHHGDTAGLFSSMSSTFRIATGKSHNAMKKARQTKTSQADVISWSGCKDAEIRTEIFEGGQYRGAVTSAFIQSMKMNPQQTYRDLLTSFRQLLAQRKVDQKPQLSSSHPMDISLRFVC